MATKKTQPKAAVVTKPVKKPVAVKPVAEKKPVKQAVEKVTRSMKGLTAQVFDGSGKEIDSLELPKTVFGVTPNTQLVSQAVRVYLANQRAGGANTKTRGEVEGSSRKIYRQKGTGRARHGSIRAHIFVGGGVAFGPVTHDFTLTMPTKMKRQALASALTLQTKKGAITIVDGVESGEQKTKVMAQLFAKLDISGSVLFVLSEKADTVSRMVRNIRGVDVVPATSVNTYDVVSHKHIVFMKQAVQSVVDIITKA